MNKAFDLAVRAQLPLLQMQMSINRNLLYHDYSTKDGGIVLEWEKRLPDLEDLFRIHDMMLAIPSLESLMLHPLLKDTAPINMLGMILKSWEENPTSSWVSPITNDMIGGEKKQLEATLQSLLTKVPDPVVVPEPEPVPPPVIELLPEPEPVPVVTPEPVYVKAPINLLLAVTEPGNWETSMDVLVWADGDPERQFLVYHYFVNSLDGKLSDPILISSSSGYTCSFPTTSPHVGGSAYIVKQETPVGDNFSSLVFSLPVVFVTSGATSGTVDWFYVPLTIEQNIESIQSPQVVVLAKKESLDPQKEM